MELALSLPAWWSSVPVDRWLSDISFLATDDDGPFWSGALHDVLDELPALERLDIALDGCPHDWTAAFRAVPPGGYPIYGQVDPLSAILAWNESRLIAPLADRVVFHIYPAGRCWRTIGANHNPIIFWFDEAQGVFLSRKPGPDDDKIFDYAKIRKQALTVRTPKQLPTVPDA